MPVNDPEVTVIDAEDVDTIAVTPAPSVPVPLDGISRALGRDIGSIAERLANVYNQLFEDPAFDRWDELRALGADVSAALTELAGQADALAHHPGAN